MPLHLTCSICAAPFTAKANRIQTAQFCSRACAAIGRTTPAAVRFWPKVNKDGPIPSHCPELGACWIWIAAKRFGGRGVFRFDGRNLGAHVVAYILTYGPVPTDKPHVLHRCDGGDIGCVRPSHLFAGTHADNVADMVTKGRQQHGERSGSAKLTESDVREIRRRYADGKTTRPELAAEFGVSRAAIYLIVIRKNWKHVA